MNGSYVDLARTEHIYEEFSHPANECYVQEDAPSFYVFGGGHGISKRKKTIPLVLIPTRKEYCHSGFHVSGHLRAHYSLFGKGGGEIETPNWTKEGDLSFQGNKGHQVSFGARND